MKTETISLMPPAPGVQLQLQVLRFGTVQADRADQASPKVYIQAALHADEIPALLVAHHLRAMLQAAEDAGALLGEVVLVPSANPIGLMQHVNGQQQGRFDLRDGTNFNRHFPELGRRVTELVGQGLTGDATRDVPLVRARLRGAAGELPASNPTQDLKRRLLQLAIDSDIVLDLHCDNDALMHLYALTPHRELAESLGAHLGVHALLLATESGDSPFDESCSRPWLELKERFPDANLPLACFACTVELRGERDVSHELAQQDAQAIMNFLRERGVLQSTTSVAQPGLRCESTPLTGSEPVTAPRSGVVVYRQALGTRVNAGDVIADIVDPESGQSHEVRCQSAGLFYARSSERWATPGKRIAKIAGTALMRTGKLLSA
jgi:uncharacterized protein